MIIIVVGGALPALLTLFLFIVDARIFGQRDVTPMASIIGSFIILWGLLRYRLFDVIPLARALVFDSLSQGLVVVDLENRIMDANAAALAIVGKTMAQIFGQPFSRVYQDWSQVIDEFDQAHEVITDVQSTSADGRVRHHELRIMAIRKPGGAVIGRLITYHDITDRKHAELALRAAQQRARLLADVAFEGVTIHRNGFVMDCNRAFLDLVGYRFEELKGMSLIDSLLAPEWRESARLSVAEKRPTHSLNEVIHKDGKRIPVEMRSRQIDDELCVTVVRDLSERREAEVQRMNAALERERAAMLAEFVRGVAHEFRTPLANISTSLYLIGKIPDGAQRAERIKQTENAIHELAALLDHMLLMVKLDHAPSLERRPLRLNMLMETVTMKYRSEMASKNLHLQFAPAVDLPMIMGDEGLLTQVFSELLINAIRFTPEKGQIRIDIGRDEHTAQVSISDTGIGMSSGEQARVFERFYRADEARTTRGFGLGLAIAGRIIALHRGSISVTGSAGAGSTFTITLPIG
jgi:PAS domain S-box-containing protein